MEVYEVNFLRDRHTADLRPGLDDTKMPKDTKEAILSTQLSDADTLHLRPMVLQELMLTGGGRLVP